VRAAVTGAGGFIGARVTAHLLARGWDVTAIDLPRALARVPPGAKRIGVDIGDQAALREALRGARVLFHAAALFDLAADWPELYATNVEGVRNVCAVARKSGVERVIIWSSASVYGGTKRPAPLSESAHVPLDQLNAYAKSKYVGEQAALEAAQADGLEVIVLRPAEVYGPGSVKGLAQALFAFKAGVMNAVAGPGTVSHSYIHVEDVAGAAIHLAERGEPGEVYNLAGPGTVATVEVYNMARKRLGWFSLPEGRITLPTLPRLWGQPLFYIPVGLLRLYGYWEVLRTRRGWLLEKFGPFPLAAPAAVGFLGVNLVVDSTKLFATGFVPAWPDPRAGILHTLEEYERSGWAPFRSPKSPPRKSKTVRDAAKSSPIPTP
jgi:nucleoside-diphosphate-sugar epimerase